MSELGPLERITDIKELTDYWSGTRDELMGVLEGVSAEDFRKRPADDSWSASELGEHLYLTQFGFARAIPATLGGKLGFDSGGIADRAKIAETTSRAQGIKNPPQVTPSNEWEKEKVLSSLQTAMDKMLKALKGKSLDDLNARGLKHGVQGDISLLEWLWTLAMHENAHLQAMKKKFGS